MTAIFKNSRHYIQYTLHLRHRIVDLSVTTFLRHDVLWNRLGSTPLGLLTERDSQMRWFWSKHEVTDSILVGVFTVNVIRTKGNGQTTSR